MPESTSKGLDAQQKREQARRRRMIGGVVGLVVVLVVVGFVLTRSRDSGPVTAAAAGDSEYGVTMGQAGAPHSIVIYEDFLCPFCGQLEARTHERLVALAAQGKVLVDYRPFQLLRPDYSEQALNAFKVVLDASGPEVALAFHNELYADQPDESGPYPDDDWLVDKAVTAGATESAVRPGIEKMSQQSWAEAATRSATDAGVTSTPTLLLDGTVFNEGSTPDEQADALVAAVS
jgi:protein-disulfide isomerase